MRLLISDRTSKFNIRGKTLECSARISTLRDCGRCGVVVLLIQAVVLPLASLRAPIRINLRLSYVLGERTRQP